MKKKLIIALAVAGLVVSTSMATTLSSNPIETDSVIKLSQRQQNVRIEFIQSAKSGSLESIAGESGHYKIILEGLNDYTNYFSDQPRRITGIISTASFFKAWDDGKIDFNKVKPNAALESVVLQSDEHINYVFELTYPKYNAANDSVVYNAKLLSSQKPMTGKLAIGYTTLFIDDYSHPWHGHIP